VSGIVACRTLQMLWTIFPLIVALLRPLFSRLSGGVKNKHHDTPSPRNGVSKGKRNLVKARSAKNQTGED